MKHFHLTLLALVLSFASFAVAPITGSLTVCQGSTTLLSDATAGGTWSSSNPAVASVGSSTGIVTGNTPGTANITYDDGIAPGMVTVTVYLTPLPITGIMSLCPGDTTTLISTTPGGVWSSANTLVAVVSSTGFTTALTSDTTTISYTLSTGCAASAVFTVLATPAVITGPSSVCTGATVTLTNGVSGGVWTSPSPNISIDVTTGDVTGITTGTASVTYTISTGCSATSTISIIPSPTPVAGPTSICTSTAVTLFSTPLGGTWTTSSTGVATADPVTGVVTGVSPGIAIVYYTVASGCFASTIVTISSTPSAGPISGPTIVCTSNSIALSGFTPGGTWSSTVPAKATIDPVTGVLTAHTVGTTIVSYTMGSFCGSDVATSLITIDTISTAGTISGTTNVCIGNTTVLSSTVVGGTWSSSDPSIATVSPLGGVHGESAGIVDITYTITLSCGTSHAITTVTVNPFAVISIVGSSSICIGTTVTLDALPFTGTWSTSSSLLSVNPVGVVTGISAGAAGVSYISPAGCLSVTMITVLPPATAGTLSGPTLLCPLSTITISSTVSGGAWGATNGHATVDPVTGVVTGVTPGVDTIFYSTSAACGVATATWGVTVSATPSAGSITGPGTVCLGLTSTLSNLTTGGTWSSSSTGIATIGSSTGIVHGLALGTTIITYLISNSCGTVYTNTVVTVTPTAGTITGTLGMCTGATTTLLSATPGGSWSGGVTTIATVNPTTGVVTGISAGTALVTYTLTGGCYSTTTVTVFPTATIAATATRAACGGQYNVVASGGVSYTWSPATGVACTTCGTTTIDPSSVTSYIVTGADIHGCSGTATATIDLNRIYGHIYYSGTTPAVLDTKVWLIKYNPSDSSIADTTNMITCLDGGLPYYEFDDVGTNSFLIKAKLQSSVPGTSDYVPTYGNSSAAWFTASGITHTGGSDMMNVNMLHGTVSSGPGFISGFVYSGAGKGTAGLIPAAGMLIYLKNPFTWDVITYTYTDATGAYSFGSLATGSYIVYPEDYDYYTTPSANVNIGGLVTNVTNVNFRQRTNSRTIKPYDPAQLPTVESVNGIVTYPNPTSGIINIEWNSQAMGTADISVTDVLGRTVFSSAIQFNAPSGKTQTDLSSLKQGVYFISIKSADIKYSTRLVIE